MGVLKKVGDFLFGKDPDIFDERGNVRHKLPAEKWSNWKDRYKNNPESNWTQHAGMRGKKIPNAQNGH